MFKKSSSKSRRGAVAVLVTVSLVALLSVVALALDGGLLLDDRRRVQAAADAAALAAADDLYLNWQTSSGTDGGGTAAKAARDNAAANGYSNDGPTSAVTVNIPPTSGNFVGQAGYAEVIIQFNQKRGFSGIFGSGDIPVRARAVARGLWTPFNDGILVLHPTAPSALNANGNGTTTVRNANIIVDSNNSLAATTVGNAFVSDPSQVIAITGTNPGYSGNFTGNIVTGQQPTPDPLAYLPTPDPSTMTVRTVPSGTNITIEPGRYVGGIQISGQTTLTMEPGIYYMDGGDFQFSGQGNLNASGVMIYSTAGLSVTGLGSVTMSPPTSGIYTGITYFQSRTSSATALVNGNGGYNITGTFYLAGGLANLQGNGDASVASQVVCLLMSSGGNGATNIVWAGPPTARTRIIGLVE
jgi:hypothetical protein